MATRLAEEALGGVLRNKLISECFAAWAAEGERRGRRGQSIGSSNEQRQRRADCQMSAGAACALRVEMDTPATRVWQRELNG